MQLSCRIGLVIGWLASAACADWVREGSIGLSRAFQLLASGGQLYARSDSGLYRTPLERDAWTPFGPQHSALGGFARTRTGWVLHYTEYPSPDQAATRITLTRDEGVRWTEASVPGNVEGLSSRGDTLFAYSKYEEATSPGRWYSFDGGASWKASAFKPPGIILACSVFPAAVTCATSNGVFQGAFTAGIMGNSVVVSASRSFEAASIGDQLVWIDDAGVLRRWGATGELWTAPLLPGAGIAILGASESEVLVQDARYTYFLADGAKAWTVIPALYGVTRFGHGGVWLGGYGFFPALEMGVWRTRVEPGNLEVTPFGSGMDRPWTTIVPPMASRLYARTGAGFWRLETDGRFRPYFLDQWGARELWTDGQTAITIPWFDSVPASISRDDGKTWQLSKFPHVGVRTVGKSGTGFLAIARSPFTAGFAVFATLDPLSPWQATHELPEGYFQDALIADGTCYAIIDSVVNVSPDAGRTWSRAAIPGKVVRLRADGDYALAVNDTGNFFLSTDRGSAWRALGKPAGMPAGFTEMTVSGGRAMVSVTPAGSPQGILYSQAGAGGAWVNLGPLPSVGGGGVAAFQGRIWSGTLRLGAMVMVDPYTGTVPHSPRGSARSPSRRLMGLGNMQDTETGKRSGRDARGRHRDQTAEAAGWEFARP